MNTSQTTNYPIPIPGSRFRPSRQSAFTMIEIAISLAVIGFALVAIIGILPRGMDVQRDNRQETIINQDYSLFMDALRNGARGMDYLTNYVIAITNYAYAYRSGGSFTRTVEWYTPAQSWGAGQYPLTNGYYIIGLLGTPQYQQVVVNPRGQLESFISNHVIADFRSISGPANEKFPQTNSAVQELALTYRLIPEVGSYGTNYFSPDWTNYTDPRISADTNLVAARLSNFLLAKYYETNLHDVRITFRWPILPSGNYGQGRQLFRSTVSGPYTNDPPTSPFFFFQPNFYYRGS